MDAVLSRFDFQKRSYLDYIPSYIIISDDLVFDRLKRRFVRRISIPANLPHQEIGYWEEEWAALFPELATMPLPTNPQPVPPLVAAFGDGWSQTGFNEFTYRRGSVQYSNIAFSGIEAGKNYNVRGDVLEFTGSAPKVTVRLGANTSPNMFEIFGGATSFNSTGIALAQNELLRFIANDNVRVNTFVMANLEMVEEFIINGDFSDGLTGWTTTGTVTAEAGRMHLVSIGGAVNASQEVGDAGVLYDISFDYEYVSGNEPALLQFGGKQIWSSDEVGTGTVNLTTTKGAATNEFIFSRSSGTGLVDFFVDNVSIQKAAE